MRLQTGPARSAERSSASQAARLAIILASMLGSLIFQFITVKAPANFYDEGLVLLNASRVMAGEVPYRDFWTLYAPGYFYVLSGVFELFGTSVLVARIFDTFVRFLVTVVVYLFARQLVSWWAALIPFAFVTLWLASIRFYLYPAFPAVGTVFLALLLFARYLATNHNRWLLFAGLALGLTAALRLDFGGYAAVGIGLALLVWELWVSPRQGRAFGRAVMFALRSGLILAGGALLVALPLFGSLAIAAGPATLWEDLIHFPATTFREVRRLPVPALLPDFATYNRENWEDWLRLYLPLSVFLVALTGAAILFWRSQAETSDRRGIQAALGLAVAVTGFGLLVKATSRYHDLHSLPAAFLAVVAAAALFARLPARIWRSLPFILFFSFFFLSAVMDPYLLHFTGQFRQVLAFHMDGCYSSLERAGCVPISPDQEAAVRWIHERTQPGEYIFVGNSRHDQICVNDNLFYFLADRPSPTPYTELHPGLATTRAVQQAIIKDLQEKAVGWVVVSEGYTSFEPNASAISSGVNDLDTYLQQNYQPVERNDSYRLYTR